MKDKFKKLGGHQIKDVGKYLQDYLTKYPQTSIYVGTDSKCKSGKVIYATCISCYDHERKDGVHLIFKRDREVGKIDVFSRMWREMEKSVEVAEYLEVELEGHLKRYSIEDLMVMKNPAGGYFKVNQNKLCHIHVDINPVEGENKKNKSFVAFESVKGYLTGLGYRHNFKPFAWCSSSSADLLCKSGSKKRDKSKDKSMKARKTA